MLPPWAVEVLRCPISGSRLEEIDRVELEERWGCAVEPAASSPLAIDPARLLVAAGQRWAYPLLPGLPVLLGPERLFPRGEGQVVDVGRAPYDEAYREMAPYQARNDDAAVASSEQGSVDYLKHLLLLSDERKRQFPDPWWQWVGNLTELTAMEEAFRHLRPLDGATAMQVGGDGLHGLNLLAAGAKQLVVVSPVLNELRLCSRVAARAGIADRLVTILGIGEQLPLGDASVDVAFSPASVHHMHTDLAFPELYRVLASGGRFASLDIFDAPLYRLGVKLFGRREQGVNCQPLDDARLAPTSVFDHVDLRWHGTSVRYVTSVLARLGKAPKKERLYKLTVAEDRSAARLPILQSQASIVTVLAEKV